MSVTAGVSDVVIAVRDKLRGKIGQTKVRRYWPGKAPQLAGAADEDGDITMFKAAASPTQDSHSYNVRKDHPRLRRLVKSRIDNLEDVRAGHRSFRQAEIVSTTEEEAKRRKELEAEEKDADAKEERRQRIKAKMSLRRKQEDEAPLLPSEDEEEVKEEEEESEYDTESEELTVILMLKPIFVPKSRRDTIAERERLESEELVLEESRKKKLEERKRETKQIVVEEIWKDKGLEQEAKIVADIDTDDEVNEAEEYKAWKARETVRIKRDREDREVMLKEKQIEKVRNMTEEERREWERANPKPAPRPKQKWMFMQKYYHKGAFFQSEADVYAAKAGTDGIYARNYSAPTGKAKMDITISPKVIKTL